MKYEDIIHKQNGQHTLKNVNNCLNANIYPSLEKILVKVLIIYSYVI
jgi:hypothetical protein